MEKILLSLGHGYTARAAAKVLPSSGWTVYGTYRNESDSSKIRASGVIPIRWDGGDVPAILQRATHVLVSAAPDADGDPSLRAFGPQITEAAPRLDWLGYLSTTGVYGDHQGEWVDETTPLTPGTQRGQWRVKAETAWQAIPDLPLHIFRLAGIYGPGRGPFAKVRAGTARRIIKPGQVFSRIHVEDIAQVLYASMTQPNPGAIYNVCDDDPVPPQDVIGLAAELLGLPMPPAVDHDKAGLGPLARSFYAESKRVHNDRIKSELGIKLLYPDYRQGLAALAKAETQRK